MSEQENKSTEGDSEAKKAAEVIRIFGTPIITRSAMIRLAVLGVIVFASIGWSYFTMIKMPGKSFVGALGPLTDAEALVRDELGRDVEKLAGEIGERNIFRHVNLDASADYIEGALVESGLLVERQGFQVQGTNCYNIQAELKGSSQPEQIVVVGAHYDSVIGTPGANDNASGVAATLALARRFGGKKTAKTLRFVFFVNEEPPFFQSEQMGSFVYAKSCRAKDENIIVMLSLETMGYFSDERGSQKYPRPFGLIYPSRGNFIGFATNFACRKQLRKIVGLFRKNCEFPCEGAAIPETIPGVAWSDHWSFWQAGYPAIMVTDTALFRYPYYHTVEDTPEKIDYDRLGRIVIGLQAVIRELTDVAGA